MHRWKEFLSAHCEKNGQGPKTNLSFVSVVVSGSPSDTAAALMLLSGWFFLSLDFDFDFDDFDLDWDFDFDLTFDRDFLTISGSSTSTGSVVGMRWTVGSCGETSSGRLGSDQSSSPVVPKADQ